MPPKRTLYWLLNYQSVSMLIKITLKYTRGRGLRRPATTSAVALYAKLIAKIFTQHKIRSAAAAAAYRHRRRPRRAPAAARRRRRPPPPPLPRKRWTTLSLAK